MAHQRNIPVQIISAFTQNGQGGNPAGVVLDADGLSAEDMLEIARQVGLSETAFVSHSDTAEYKLDFFTPTKQIAHCGHATIATFSYLGQEGKLAGCESSKETIDGNRRIKMDGAMAYMEQSAPSYQAVPDQQAQILASLRLQESQLAPGLPIQLVNTGNNFLIIPVASRQVLAQLSPDFDLIGEVSEELDLIGYYVFATDTEREDLDATTRMFAPRYGIREDSGTGMAAGPLACYLRDTAGRKAKRFKIQQGKYMDRPSQSLIVVNLETNGSEITGLMAGGKGVVKEQRTITLDA